MKHRFILISRWHLTCGIDAAWARISVIRRWPQWWPNVARVDIEGEAGDTPRAGSAAWVHWKTRLGYGLRLRVIATGVMAPCELEGRAEGDLQGRGLWLLEPQADHSVVITYRWDVHLNKPWMRFLAPVLRPVFAWNHFDAMRACARAMAHDIGGGCRVLRYVDYTYAPHQAAENLRSLDWPQRPQSIK